jgi:hypothetical protein
MLPGLSAEQWSRPLRPLGTVVMCITFVAGAAYFLMGGKAETVPPWLYAIFALALVIFFVGMFVMFAGLLKAIRESKAGYTTTGGAYPELPQLDSKTGEVLREPGSARTREPAQASIDPTGDRCRLRIHDGAH